MRVLAQESGGDTGTPMPGGPISGPSAWYGPELEKSDAWIYRISDAEQAELDAALAGVRGREIATIRKDDFPLPTFGAALDALRQEVLRGRGFVLLRGLPVERYSFDEAAMAYWGIGMHFGKPLPQNGKGHLLGHIADLGRDVADVTARTYQTTARQLYHTDSCDIVSLLCLQKAKSGGLSSLVSSVTIFNEMQKRRPDLAAQLFQPYQTDRREEIPPGQRPFYSVPIFNWHDGLFSCQYTRRYVESAQRFPEVGPYSPIRMEALDMLDALANDPALHLHMAFEPGDMQFVHNHQIMHDRTAYEDWPDRKRHLLRLWLCPPDGRPLPPAFEEKLNGPPTIGDRGGIYLAGIKPNVPPQPE